LAAPWSTQPVAPRTIPAQRSRPAALAIVVIAVFLGASCAGPAAPSLPPTAPATAAPTPEPSQTIGRDGLTESDWTLIDEAQRLMGSEGPDVFVGWGSTPPPVLVQGTEADWLIGHPAPPTGFEPVAGLDVDGRQVLRRLGRLVPGLGVQEVAGVFSVAALPRPALQALVDDQLGAGAVILDEVQYVRWITHEAFHAFQLTTLAGELPRFGFDGSEAEMVRDLTATPGFAGALARDGILLRDALAARDDEALRAATRRFLEGREARRASSSTDVAPFERAVEWAEGLARYADVRLLQAAGSGYAPPPAFLALADGYPDPATTWADSTRWLADLGSVPGTLRDQYYELGAAQAYLLDRLMPGWQARALPGGESLEALLTEALAAGDRGVPASLRALAVRTVRVGDLRLRVAVADAPDAWTRGLAGVRDLGRLDGLLFTFPEPVAASFHMRGALVPLDLAFIDPDGRIASVTTMPLCSVDPCPTYGSPVPYRWALEAADGTLRTVSAGDVLALD
jgi:uncharacterized membrane protein (UPF0127 family)